MPPTDEDPQEIPADSPTTSIIRLQADEQLAFWTALTETPRLTEAQKELGALMRGES